MDTSGNMAQVSPGRTADCQAATPFAPSARSTHHPPPRCAPHHPLVAPPPHGSAPAAPTANPNPPATIPATLAPARRAVPQFNDMSSSGLEQLPTGERPRGGFAFDLCSRDQQIGTSIAAGGGRLPQAMKTGTTIVGVIYKDGVVLGADTRATGGTEVGVVASSGGVGGRRGGRRPGRRPGHKMYRVVARRELPLAWPRRTAPTPTRTTARPPAVPS